MIILTVKSFQAQRPIDHILHILQQTAFADFAHTAQGLHPGFAALFYFGIGRFYQSIAQAGFLAGQVAFFFKLAPYNQIGVIFPAQLTAIFIGNRAGLLVFISEFKAEMLRFVHLVQPFMDLPGQIGLRGFAVLQRIKGQNQDTKEAVAGGFACRRLFRLLGVKADGQGNRYCNDRQQNGQTTPSEPARRKFSLDLAQFFLGLLNICFQLKLPGGIRLNSMGCS